MGMTIDGLEKECRYCYREIDNSGLEGFRCTNRIAIKARASSWCYPKNANEPCSTCEFCETKDDEECLFYETCSSRTAVCKVRQPDIGCLVYRYFKDLIVKDYENRLKADMVAMLTDLSMEIGEIEDGYVEFDEENKRSLTMIPLESVERLIDEKINNLKEDTT